MSENNKPNDNELKSETNTECDNNDNEFHNIFKCLLMNLKQEFVNEFNDQKLLKRVAKLENIANNVNNKYLLSKFKLNLNRLLDALTTELKTSIDENESITENNKLNNIKIMEFIQNISVKQKQMELINDLFIKNTSQMHEIIAEESREKQILQVLEDENQVLSQLKTNFMQNFNAFKEMTNQ